MATPMTFREKYSEFLVFGRVDLKLHLFFSLLFGILLSTGIIFPGIMIIGMIVFFLLTVVPLVLQGLANLAPIIIVLILLCIFLPFTAPFIIGYFMIRRIGMMVRNWRPILLGVFFYAILTTLSISGLSGELSSSIYQYCINTALSMHSSPQMVLCLLMLVIHLLGALAFHIGLVWLYSYGYDTKTALGLIGILPLLILAFVLPFLTHGVVDGGITGAEAVDATAMGTGHAVDGTIFGVGHAADATAFGAGHAAEATILGAKNIFDGGAAGFGHAADASTVGTGHAFDMGASGFGHATGGDAAFLQDSTVFAGDAYGGVAGAGFAAHSAGIADQAHQGVGLGAAAHHPNVTPMPGEMPPPDGYEFVNAYVINHSHGIDPLGTHAHMEYTDAMTHTTAGDVVHANIGNVLKEDPIFGVQNAAAQPPPFGYHVDRVIVPHSVMSPGAGTHVPLPGELPPLVGLKFVHAYVDPGSHGLHGLSSHGANFTTAAQTVRENISNVLHGDPSMGAQTAGTHPPPGYDFERVMIPTSHAGTVSSGGLDTIHAFVKINPADSAHVFPTDPGGVVTGQASLHDAYFVAKPDGSMGGINPADLPSAPVGYVHKVLHVPSGHDISPAQSGAATVAKSKLPHISPAAGVPAAAAVGAMASAWPTGKQAVAEVISKSKDMASKRDFRGAATLLNSITTNKPKLFLLRGSYYARGKMPDEAIADLNKAISLEPSLAQAYYYRGLSYIMKGDKKRAIVDFLKYLKLAPDAPERAKVIQIVKKMHEQLKTEPNA